MRWSRRKCSLSSTRRFSLGSKREQTRHSLRNSLSLLLSPSLRLFLFFSSIFVVLYVSLVAKKKNQFCYSFTSSIIFPGDDSFTLVRFFHLIRVIRTRYDNGIFCQKRVTTEKSQIGRKVGERAFSRQFFKWLPLQTLPALPGLQNNPTVSLNQNFSIRKILSMSYWSGTNYRSSAIIGHRRKFSKFI